MSAIHKRLHYSQRIEFNLLAGLFRDYLPPQYPYMTANGDQSVKQSDFDDRIDIIPVSDPNIFSMSQRVMMAQEMLRMVRAAPEIHGPMGIYNAYKRMYEAMGIQQVDQILPPPPPPPQPQPVAAVLENSGFVATQPATPFLIKITWRTYRFTYHFITLLSVKRILRYRDWSWRISMHT